MRKRFTLAALIVAMVAVHADATVTGNPPPASYACNSSTTVFSIPFPYLATSQIVATTTATGGVVTNLILNTDYTVKPAVAPSTGTLTLTTACATGSTLTVSRTLPLTQPQGFRTGNYQGAAHEQAFDRLEMQLQQVNGKIANPVTPSAITNATTILPRGATTALQLQDLFSYTVNVKAFGAVGDGIIDDSAAIQAAINAIPANGGEVYFPPGIYLVNTSITTTKPSLTLRGAGGAGWNVGAATRINTTAAIIVFDIGSATVTEHRGVRVYGMSVSDTSNGGAGGVALGAFRVRRQNQVLFQDVTVNSFAAGYALTLDGTPDAVTIPHIVAFKGRANFLGIVQIGAVTGMWVAPSTYFAGPSNAAGSIGITLTGDTAVIEGAIELYETGVKISGDMHKVFGARFESNNRHVWIAGPSARRTIITGNSFSAGGSIATVQIDNNVNIFDTLVADNQYSAPTVGIIDNSPNNSNSYIFEPQQNNVTMRKVVTGALQWNISNNRQNGAATDLAELRTTSNGITASLRAGADGTAAVGTTGNQDFTVITNSAASARFQKDVNIASGSAGLLLRTNTAGTLRLDQVTVAAPDSCGVGFRCLRVPN